MPESQPPPPEPDPDSQPSPRPVAHTIMGGLEAPAAERLQQQHLSPPARPIRSPASPHEAAEEGPLPPGVLAEQRGMTDLSGGPEDNRWRVALTQQDLRWMTTEEIVEAFRSGAVKLETFVFRAGMPTWVTLPEVPEIAAALAAGGASPSSLPPAKTPSSRPPPRRAPARGQAEPGTLAALAELDSSEPMPFALVAQRSNGAMAAAHEAERGRPPQLSPQHPPQFPPQSAALEGSPAFEPPSPYARAERLSIETVPAESLSQVPDEPVEAPLPFAAAQQASGSGRWVWVVVALLVVAAAGAYLASRQGLKLF